MSPQFFVGIDLGSKEHQACCVDSQGGEMAQIRFDHDWAGLVRLRDWLSTLAPVSHDLVTIALESPHGPVVEFLLEQRYPVVSINPRQVDRFRERFKNSGAKDDSLDARVIAWSLRTDPQAFRAVELPPPAILELREISRFEDALKAIRIEASNQLQHLLGSRFPTLLSLCSRPIYSPAALDLCRMFPCPDSARHATLEVLEEYIRRRRIRRFDAQTALARLSEFPLPMPGGIGASMELVVGLSCDHVELLNRLVADCSRRIDSLLVEISDDQKRSTPGLIRSDAELLESIPGCGPYVLSRLLAEAHAMFRARDYAALRLYSGVAPVTMATGLQCHRGKGKRRRPTVVMRRACNHRLRNAIFHWARTSIPIVPGIKERYESLRNRGQRHGQALRTIGDRLLSLACAILRNGTPYDPDRRVADPLEGERR